MRKEEPLNPELAPKQCKQLERLIRERSSVPQQVLNTKEMSLVWKRMLSHTFKEIDKNLESLEET